jgi:rhodanese-related sulfurtransferase
MGKRIACLLAFLLLVCGSVYGGFRYEIKADHAGGNVTPSQAYEMVQKDPSHTFIVDARTRAEYQLVGHPVGSINIPKKFWNGKLGEKEYTMVDNPDFAKDLLARFNPSTDKLIFMCRSGKRSCLSCQAAIDAGWDPKNVCNMLGGFEGDKLKNANSIHDGKRILGGWKNEGLPWTYHIDKKLVYAADLAQ